MIKIFLKAHEEDTIRQGFPWVFDNEIGEIKASPDDDAQDGCLAEVYSKSGLFLGCGILNRTSKIQVRLLTTKKETIDEAFFEHRIREALDIRFLSHGKSDSYRLIFAEADFIPGLIVERYCDATNRVFLVVQFLALAAERFRNEIVSALRTVCRPIGIYERSDASVRTLEGLEGKKGWIGAEFNTCISIRENGILLSIDMENGQKTGHFLDQRENRRIVAQLAKGRRVLDTFTHTGAFALCAVKGGAKEVIAIDISEEAIQNVSTNISLNNAASYIKVLCADVFDILKQYEQAGEQFDMIILDPPAFTKSAKAIEKAYGGYKEINLRAMKLIKRGGILVSCSCSHFFDAHTFYDMIHHAAVDAKRSVQILEKRGAGWDHPLLLGYPKSEYLKCMIARIL